MKPCGQSGLLVGATCLATLNPESGFKTAFRRPPGISPEPLALQPGLSHSLEIDQVLPLVQLVSVKIAWSEPELSFAQRGVGSSISSSSELWGHLPKKLCNVTVDECAETTHKSGRSIPKLGKQTVAPGWRRARTRWMNSTLRTMDSKTCERTHGECEGKLHGPRVRLGIQDGCRHRKTCR